MVMYDRSGSSGYRTIDAFDDGFGWLAHPQETGLHASHAFVGDGGVWLFDPLDAPGIDEKIDALGDVAGIVVCSRYPARDSAAFARRYDVPVSVPSWMGRVPEHLEVPLEYYERELGSSGFAVEPVGPVPGWSEGVAYRERDDTLYIPDLLGTAPLYTVGPERLGVLSSDAAVRGVYGPRSSPDSGRPRNRTLRRSAGGLVTALANAHRGFPRALLEHGPTQLRALVGALGE